MRTFLQYFAKSSRGNDCYRYGTDSDGDNNNNSADEDKNDGDGNDTDGGSNGERGSNGENDAKDSGVEMMMLIEIEMMMLIYKVIMVLKANYLQSNFVSISTVFDANMSVPGSIICK